LLGSCDKVSRCVNLHYKTRLSGDGDKIMGGIEFWYEFGSNYSYPAVIRIEKLAAQAGVLAAANTPENKDALRRQTEEAASRGLFGAPSFTIGDELNWGNDRLEAVLLWAKS
jgi:2-hydroxychromene-2-carboxylate isomerase